MLIFSHVSRYYPNGYTLFRDLSFCLFSGETVCFSGAAHSGKSFLLKMMMGLEMPTSGSVLFQRKNWARLHERSTTLLRRHIGLMGSPATLLTDRTLKDNLELPLRLRGIYGKTLQNTVESTLRHLELHERVNDPVSSLSWNEQYRLSLGRAFIHRPKLVLADTPLTRFREDESSFFEWVNRIRSPETTLVCTETQPMQRAERLFLLSSEQWMNRQN